MIAITFNFIWHTIDIKLEFKRYFKKKFPVLNYALAVFLFLHWFYCEGSERKSRRLRLPVTYLFPWTAVALQPRSWNSAPRTSSFGRAPLGLWHGTPPRFRRPDRRRAEEVGAQPRGFFEDEQVRVRGREVSLTKAPGSGAEYGLQVAGLTKPAGYTQVPAEPALQTQLVL